MLSGEIYQLIEEGTTLLDTTLEELSTAEGEESLGSNSLLSIQLETVAACTLRCAFLLKNRRDFAFHYQEGSTTTALPPQQHPSVTNAGTEGKSQEGEGEETSYKQNLLERIASLGVSSDQQKITTKLPF